MPPEEAAKKKRHETEGRMRCGHYRGGTAPISELPHPAHFHEVAFEVEELRVGFADLVGKRDLRAEPEHRDRRG